LSTLRAYLESQIKTLKTERDNINGLLDRKSEELSRTRSEFSAENRKLHEEINNLRN
jgi:hypothetical protein